MTNQPILVRSPYRISLFGGSCDISEYFSKHQALLIGFAVGHYSYILLRKTPYILPYHTLVQCHDIERGLGHRGIDPELEKFAEQAAPGFLDEIRVDVLKYP